MIIVSMNRGGQKVCNSIPTPILDLQPSNYLQTAEMLINNCSIKCQLS